MITADHVIVIFVFIIIIIFVHNIWNL